MFPKDPLFRLIALVGHLHTRQLKRGCMRKKNRDPKKASCAIKSVNNQISLPAETRISLHIADAAK